MNARLRKESRMEIGIIGMGSMGRKMARNLVAAGHAVTAWNRSGGAVDGVRMVDAPVHALQADIALTMLSDDAAIRAVLLDAKLLQQARPGLVHVVASTISVAFAHELVALHRSAGVAYVAAPVLGRPDIAAKGELNVLAAGAPAALARVMPALDAIGKQVWDMGEAPPAAYAAKLACNMMITMAIEAMAEAVVLTEANGLSRTRFFELILGTLFGSRPYRTYSRNIVENAYRPGFKASLGLKDLRLAGDAAAQAGRTLPMLAVVRDRMAEAVEAGMGDCDWSVFAGLTVEAGGFRVG
ncbi:NAD(P)-dependent oxidoreductase [Burkholderia vietnamiensis]|uniref:NAD(P)-dependent oxidoreductase n=1 Tax=Burkholderia vietnamiensis TaxID=60552 RepID=UPI00265587D0|nr:NAD(P)-dependent oxidoreductase [Burkholderia vietnamiensis]MDN8040702.1 NAD(P)-dependent oxidoreductase [Burkholderia vietnamiensis]